MLGLDEHTGGEGLNLDILPLLCYNVSMKKAIVITAILVQLTGVGGAVWLVANLNSQKPVETAQAQPKPELKKDKYDVGPADAQEMLELVNRERAKVGAAPLVLDERLNQSAQEKANDMTGRNYYGHVSPDGVHGYSLAENRTKGSCGLVGENIIKNLYDANSQNTINEWMNSKPHREAILDPRYTKTGFGISESSIVQHFCEEKQ